MEMQVDNKFVGLGQLAIKWGVSVRTLKKYINKIALQIPMYDEKQRLFAPIQYKKISELLGFDA